MKAYYIRIYFVLLMSLIILNLGGTSLKGEEKCVECHKSVNSQLVIDWQNSKHSESDVTCSSCHGFKHQSKSDISKVKMPDEAVCGECHDTRFEQFKKGKHNHGWTSMMAIPATHMEPQILMAGGKGCGGCHNMGVKSEEQKKELREKGYFYRTNSCDECHTRHTFSKKEAQDPKACQMCHMGFDHPQWEMYESSKHGERYAMKEIGRLPENASAPTCQTCHLPNGTHTNKVGWGFLAVRLPMPRDKQWAKDRTAILKALGVLDPNGKPTGRLDLIKKADMARLTEKAWKDEREKMLNICSNCHSRKYARGELEKGDQMIREADRLMAEAIEVVADLYKEGILKKPKHYTYAYPDFLHFYQTGGSYIEQVLFKMFMKHRMRAYQGVFHANPDYAYWYGYAAMIKDLDEIKKLADNLKVKARVRKKL